MTNKISDDTDSTIPLRNLLAICGALAVAVAGYFSVTERISFLEHDGDKLKMEVEMNSEFRVKWPRGELGALPDDAEQNIRLDFLEERLKELEGQLK